MALPIRAAGGAHDAAALCLAIPPPLAPLMANAAPADRCEQQRAGDQPERPGGLGQALMPGSLLVKFPKLPSL